MFFKNTLMNSYETSVKLFPGLDIPQLVFDIKDNLSTVNKRQQHKLITRQDTGILVPFDYTGVRFNMITCPMESVGLTKSGGGYNLQDDVSDLISTNQPYLLGETEVTQELFKAVMGFNYSSGTTRYVSTEEAKLNNPVDNVSWYDCIVFCNKLSLYFQMEEYYEVKDKKIGGNTFIGKAEKSVESAVVRVIGGLGFRLPESKEWRLAAESGEKNIYSGTSNPNSAGDFAWFKENSPEYKTHPVAQKKPNEWGFYDMTGNVSEWCWDESVSKTHIVHGGNVHDSISNKDLKNSTINVSGLAPRGVRSSGIGFRIAKSLA
jgi:hypothetical protein